MKKSLLPLAALAAVAFASSANATDLASKKAPPAPVAPVPMWKGLYVGLNAGGVWGNNSSISANTFATSSYSQSNPAYWVMGNGAISGTSQGGFIGGGQVGYNWQPGLLNNNLVFGFEADIQGVAAGKSNRTYSTAYAVGTETLTNTTTANANLEFLGTVRGRVGYLAMPNLLIYGTGGLAYGGVSFSATKYINEFASTGAQNWTGVGSTNYSNVNVGYTGGGGVEWMFMPNWSAKAEYLYYDLGNVSAQLDTNKFGLAAGVVTQPFNSTTYTGRVNGNIARLGVNYHFNSSPAAVVAKY